LTSGVLFVISAPSGCGKTTILDEILRSTPGLIFSISHTTRAPRAGEQDGVAYHFTDEPLFRKMVGEDAFLEWAEVHGKLYGTSKGTVEHHRRRGLDVLLDIDTQGALQVRERLPAGEAVLIFIVPPSWQELERRLSGRGTELPENVTLRLKNARREMQCIDHYDFVVVNDDLPSAIATLRAIIIAERSRRRCSPDGLPIPILADLATDDCGA